MSLIGQRWKRSNVCSWLILISRKLHLKQAQVVKENDCEIRNNVQFWGCRKTPEYAPVAQLVEQLTLNQWVLGSSPCRCTKWPIGQVVKTAASHAVNIGSNPVWVTKIFFDFLLTGKIDGDIISLLLEANRLLTIKDGFKPIERSWYWLSWGSTCSHTEHRS